MSFASAREKSGLTQKEVAEKLRVDQSSVSWWETGKNNPRASLLPAIATLYGCTIDELLSDSKED